MENGHKRQKQRQRRSRSQNYRCSEQSGTPAYSPVSVRAPSTYDKDPHLDCSGKPEYARQGIVLTGLSSPSFDKSLCQLEAIMRTFDRCFPPDSLEKWTPGKHGEHNSVDLANRYLVDKKNVNAEDIVSIPIGIDPRRILAKLAGSSYVCTEDNVVKYFEAVKEEEDKIR